MTKGKTMEFTTILSLDGVTATGIQVPAEVVDALGGGKRIPVRVALNGVEYPSTIATMKGRPSIPVSAEIRSRARVNAGDEITVRVEKDDSPRTVDIPVGLRSALDSDPAAAERFAALSYSNQRRHVIAVTGARTDETRERRIRRILDELHS
jgi:hypothetical protein